jgi:hypothetical protein
MALSEERTCASPMSAQPGIVNRMEKFSERV